jgi:hypothetical protein
MPECRKKVSPASAFLLVVWLQSGIGIPASEFSLVPLVTDYTVNPIGFIYFLISFSIESSLILKLMCPIGYINFHCDLWIGSCGGPGQ